MPSRGSCLHALSGDIRLTENFKFRIDTIEISSIMKKNFNIFYFSVSLISPDSNLSPLFANLRENYYFSRGKELALVQIVKHIA
jgi:hypothetical protein